MSILTKEERGYIQGNLDDGLKMRRGEWQDQALATICENHFQDALDTIDALEKERDIAQETIDSCFEILEDMGFSTVDPDGCGLPGIVCDMAGALNALRGGLK